MFQLTYESSVETMLLKLMQEKRADTTHAIGGPTESAQKISLHSI